MPTCPKCHKEVDQLLEEETRTSKCRVELADEEGRCLQYDDEKDTEVEQTFDCPLCYATLSLCSEEDARAFLKGELPLED